jgi:hypothetical protein
MWRLETTDYLLIAFGLVVLVTLALLTWHAQRDAWAILELREDRLNDALRHDGEILRLEIQVSQLRAGLARAGGRAAGDPALYCDQDAADEWRLN